MVRVGSDKRENRDYVLKVAPLDCHFSISEGKLSFESDRPNVLFLDKQTKLLG